MPRMSLTTATSGMTDHAASTRWIATAKAALRDLTTPNPWIYWADLLTTVTVGYAAAWLYLDMTGFSLTRALAYGVAVLALFRAGTFTHELVHLRRSQMPYFRVAYDLLYGIVALFPSFAYAYHADHHRIGNFGTERDGEYMPLHRGPYLQLLIFFAHIFYLPIAVTFRFLVLTPLSFFNTRLRTFVLERASSFGMSNLEYRGRAPSAAALRYWTTIEWLCFLRITLAIALVVAGIHEPSRLLLLYSLASGALFLNFLRVLGLHGYCNEGEELSHADQLADTVTIARQPVLQFIVFPLGMSYHTLHHMFPSLPYHNLGRAHRRLMQILPQDSTYVRTVYDGYGAVLRHFWREMREVERNKVERAKAATATT
jgi:fatty acid desaturase